MVAACERAVCGSENSGVLVQDGSQLRQARDAVGQGMVHAQNESPTTVLETLHDVNIPKRFAAIEPAGA